MMFDYTKNDIIQALKNVGIQEGDSLFSHSNIGFLGTLQDCKSKEDFYKIFKEALFEVIGSGGTFIVPTFSYSFCRGEVYDLNNTPGTCGLLSEMIRKDPEAFRSEDANFSVAAIGKNAEYFTQDAPEYSFGPESFWEKFLQKDGKFCNINFDSASTFLHYVERELKVPYRWDKPFEGILKTPDKEEKRVFYHFVYDLDKPEHRPDFTKFDKKAKELGLAKSANLGRGQIVVISAKDSFYLFKEQIKTNPAFLITGDKI